MVGGELGGGFVVGFWIEKFFTVELGEVFGVEGETVEERASDAVSLS